MILHTIRIHTTELPIYTYYRVYTHTYYRATYIHILQGIYTYVLQGYLYTHTTGYIHIRTTELPIYTYYRVYTHTYYRATYIHILQGIYTYVLQSYLYTHTTELLIYVHILYVLQGYTTYLMRTDFEFRGLGFIWTQLERRLPPEVKESVRGMTLCKDKQVQYMSNKSMHCSLYIMY